MPHEPKRKHSQARKRTRRAAIHLKAAFLSICSNCNEKTIAHMACRNCGFYDGRSIKAPQTSVKVTRA